MKSKVLEDSGERMIPEAHKGTTTYAEHYGRYVVACRYIRDKTILDIACGTGYGTQLMASTAKTVMGVDVDESTVLYAKENFNAKNITYKKSDGRLIPANDSKFDVVVSMETIEHIQDQEGFLKEIKRVLKPSGLLILSTPNDKVSPKGNHYHVKEHTKVSLKKLVQKHFKSVKMAYQTVDITASIFDEDTLTSEQDLKQVPVLKLNKIQPDNSLFYIVFASSDRRVVESIDVGSLVVLGETYSHMHQKELQDTIDDLNNLAHRYQKDISDLLAAVGQRDEAIAAMENKHRPLREKFHPRRVGHGLKKRLGRS